MQNNLEIFSNNSLKELKTPKKNDNYTLIQIDNTEYALETEKILNIIKLPELDTPSQLPDYILGYIKYNSSTTAVIDLREVFKKERTIYNLSAKIIIMKTKKDNIAIICDNVVDIIRLEKEKINKIDFQGEKSFYQGTYSYENSNIYILDIENILKYAKENVDNKEKNENIGNYIISDEKSKAILKERKEFFKKIEENIQKDTPLYDIGVSFINNGVKYYINLASVKEFFKINDTKIIKVPSIPEYIMGLINIKGEYISILDIRKFYNCEKSTIKEKSTIIILNSNEFKIGILADEILDTMNINFNEIIQNRLQKQDDGKILEFVKDNEIYQVLDIEKLLQDERFTIC